jgi:hypothetical protein
MIGGITIYHHPEIQEIRPRLPGGTIWGHPQATSIFFALAILLESLVIGPARCPSLRLNSPMFFFRWNPSPPKKKWGNQQLYEETIEV